MKQPSRKRLLAFQAITVFLAGLLAFAVMEVTLRIFPNLIGVTVLTHFEPDLRSRIAEELGLPTMGKALRITPDMRTDHGPAILLPGANSLTVTYADKMDIDLGAIETVQVDQNGLCNDPSQAAGGKTDIFLAGDSFTFCTAVLATDTAAYKIQQLSGRTTYNLGVRGVGPYEYLELMKRHAPALKPHIAIMNIYEGNDLRDVLRTKEFIESGGHGEDAEDRASPAWSYASQFIQANAQVLASTIKRMTGNLREHDFRYAAKVAGKLMAMNITNRDQDEAAHALRLQHGEISLESFRPPLEAFVEWARQEGITPIVTYTPSMYTAYARTVVFDDAEVGAAVQNMSKLQRKWFSENAAAIGFHFFDFTAGFRRAAEAGELTHFPANVHLTPKGHDIIARSVSELLRTLP